MHSIWNDNIKLDQNSIQVSPKAKIKEKLIQCLKWAETKTRWDFIYELVILKIQRYETFEFNPSWGLVWLYIYGY